MKRTLFILLTIVLCFSAFSGCDTIDSQNETTDNDIIKAPCYVTYLATNGFVTSIDGFGDVFVRYANANESIKLYDTVIIEYEVENIKKTHETFTTTSGLNASCSYVLEEIKSLRIADPKAGDMIFG